MTAQNRSYVIDMSELNQDPPSFAESERRNDQNGDIVPVNQENEQQQPQQGAFVEKIEPPDYSHYTPGKDQQQLGTGQQPSPNVPVDVIPPEQIQYVTPLENLGEIAKWIDCPFCKRRTETRVQHEDSSATTLAGAVCCLFCVCLTCLPCMMGWFQDTDHFCKGCNRKVTHQPHDGPVQVQGPRPSGQQVSVYHYPQGQQQMHYRPQNQDGPYQGSPLPPNSPSTQRGLPNGVHQSVPPQASAIARNPSSPQQQQEPQQHSPQQPSMYQSAGQASPEPVRLA
ncbi:hypothetical protein MBLNU230_g5097t1 [Neophaeotheca triangularis]